MRPGKWEELNYNLQVHSATVAKACEFVFDVLIIIVIVVVRVLLVLIFENLFIQCLFLEFSYCKLLSCTTLFVTLACGFITSNVGIIGKNGVLSFLFFCSE